MWNISDSSRGCIKSIRMHSTYVCACVLVCVRWGWGVGGGGGVCVRWGWGVGMGYGRVTAVHHCLQAVGVPDLSLLACPGWHR